MLQPRHVGAAIRPSVRPSVCLSVACS